MGLFDRMINNVVGSMSHAVGREVGNAVGGAVGEMAGESLRTVTTDIKVQNEQKLMNLAEQQKAENLPPHCPHCGAPTNKQLVCEYCNCKIVE